MTRNKDNIQINPATVLIAYHANCIDGFTSAWVTARAMKSQGKSFDMLPMHYTDTDTARLLTKLTTETNYERLYVVDFSLSLDALEYLDEEVADLNTTILDHHKTAFERYFPDEALYPYTVKHALVHGAEIALVNNKSGAGICWTYFNGEITPPMIVQYAQDYDLWQFHLGDDTRYVNSYLSSCAKTLAKWNEVALTLDTTPELILDAGKVIYDKFIDECKEYAEAAIPCLIAGMPGLVIECPGEYASQVGNILAVHSGTYGLMYQRLDDGTIKYSIRSNGDYDVTTIAKQFGGGGHKNASGFSTEGAVHETY